MCQEIDYDTYKGLVDRGETLILDLYLEKCIPCQQMMPMMSGLDIPGVKVIKMDILKNRRIYHELGLKTAPTLIYFENGQEKTRLVGVQDEQAILEMVS